MSFSPDALNIDVEKEVERIVTGLRTQVGKTFKKRGAVVGVSGGVDSSVVLALCVKAFGPNKVLVVLMPDQDSSPDNFILTRDLIRRFDVESIVEDMTPALAGFGCYRRRDEAIKSVFPEYDMSYRAKIVLPENMLDTHTLNVFYLTIISPEGEEKTERIPLKEYLKIVAASNFKQRSRMAMLYYHAEARNYSVIGTANKNEHEMGFFVKFGDGGADVKPIVHLFKTQVYQLAGYLDVPEEIRKRTPTSDTYSAEQTQEEFFFRLPFHLLDLVWHGWEQGAAVADIAKATKLNEDQVEFAIEDLKRKIHTTDYLRANPVVI
ncbi:MAG: NAD(+) synthase [Candidatus Latescibacterota bacterium]|jgi:NAD+ synthase